MNEELQTLTNTDAEISVIQEPQTIVNSELVKKAAKVIRAVNHPLRQSMINLINQNRSVNVTDLYVKLRIEQSVASQHLKILRGLQIVNTRRVGKQIFYSVNHERIAHIMTYSDALVNQ